MIRLFQKVFGSASFWAMVSVGLRVTGGLITLPLALRVLLPAELGLYYTFLSMTGLALLLDFGFAQTIGRNAAFAMGGAEKFQAVGIPDGNRDEAPNWILLAELLSAVKAWYNGIAWLLAILMFIPGSIYLLPLIQKAGLPDSYLGCWWFHAGVTVYSFVSTYWVGMLFGIGSVKCAARIGIISQVFGLVILLAGLFSGLGLWSYGLSSFASATISLCMAKKTFFRDAKQSLQIEVTKIKRRQVLSCLWPMAWRQGIVMLGAFLIQRGNTLICSSQLGLQETASFGLSSNILNLLFQVVMIPLSLAWPIIGRLRVSGQFSQIRQIFFVRLYCGLIVSILLLYLIGSCSTTIFKFLGAKTQLLPSPLFYILGVITLLEWHHSQYGSLVLSENKNPFVLQAIVSGIAIFTLSWWAAGHWGLIGMIVAQGCVQLAWNNWWTIVRGIKGVYPKDNYEN